VPIDAGLTLVTRICADRLSKVRTRISLVAMEDTRSNRLPIIIFAFLLLLATVQWAHWSPLLPTRIAVHFQGSGLASGWMPRETFLYLQVALFAFFALVSFGVPKILGMVPTSAINLPNKEYWFAPERRAGTVRYFAAQFGWIGCALVTLFIAIDDLIFRATLSTPQRLDNGRFLLALGIFLGFLALWIARMMIRFGRTEG
jgi:uncharacterized membrane protein